MKELELSRPNPKQKLFFESRKRFVCKVRAFLNAYNIVFLPLILINVVFAVAIAEPYS